MVCKNVYHRNKIKNEIENAVVPESLPSVA